MPTVENAVHVEVHNVTKLKIQAPNMDLISAYIEDLGDSQGKVIIESYGDSWSTFWNGMGNQTIAEFFCSCNNDYIINRFNHYISDTIKDWDTFSAEMREKIIELRKEECIDKFNARQLFEIDDWSEYITDNPYEPVIKPSGVFMDDEDWEELDFGGFDIPEMPNPRYTRLEKIINTVKKALVDAGYAEYYVSH